MQANEIEYYLSLSMPEFCSMQTGPEGDRYVLEVIGWPGCSAAGKTRDEAAVALREAKRGWLVTRSKRGMAVPLPTREVQVEHRHVIAALEIAKQIVVSAAVDHQVLPPEVLQQDRSHLSLYDLTRAILVDAQLKTNTKSTQTATQSATRATKRATKGKRSHVEAHRPVQV